MMQHLKDLTSGLTRLSALTDARALSPTHVHIWLRGLDTQAVLEPEIGEIDPTETFELQLLSERVDQTVLEIGLEAIAQGFNPGQEEVSPDQLKVVTDFVRSIEVFSEAAVRRQEAGEQGWVYTVVVLIETIGQQIVTPQALDIFVRSLELQSSSHPQHPHAFDA